MIALALPLPPSTNALWRSRKASSKPHLSSEYQAWKQEAGWIVQASQVDRISGEYDVHIFVPKGMPGDIDNRVKAILDLCKEHVTDDDKHCQDQRITRSRDVPKGTCVVRITNSATAGNAGAGQQGVGFAPTPIPDEARRGVIPQG